MDVRRHSGRVDFATWHGGPSRKARRQRRVGAVLLAASLLGATFASMSAPSGAIAQEAPEPVPATITKEAYFTQSGGAVIPDTVVREFPPGVVCVVRPEACRQELEPVTDPINEQLESNPPEETVPEEPAQPVTEGTLPTGVQGGNPRYVSYLHLELPEVPEGKEIDTFELLLHQEGVNYRQDSPAFREAVEAAALCFQARPPTPDRENPQPPDPEDLEEAQAICDREFRQALASEPMRSDTESPFAIEACLVLGEWEGAPNQEYADQPERDCIVYASTGKFDEETQLWTFDVSFIVAAWIAGTYENHGLYFGPLSAENLAFGDRDTSSNAQLSFGAKDGEVPPQIVYTLKDAYVPPPPPPPPTTGTTGTTGTTTTGTDGGSSGTSGTDGGSTGVTSGSDGGDTSGSTGGSTGVTTGSTGTSSTGSTGSTGFTSGTTGTSGTSGTSGGTDVYAPPPNLPGGQQPPAATAGGEPDPEVAPDPEGAPPTTGAAPPPTVAGATERPFTPWWVWLLIPIGLAGLYYLARSLTAEPEVALERPGAMTRLIERQQAHLGGQTPALQV